MSKADGELPDFDQLEELDGGLFDEGSEDLQDAGGMPAVDLSDGDDAPKKGKRKKKEKAKKEKKPRKKKVRPAKADDGDDNSSGLAAIIEKADVYTIMLGLAVLTILLAILLLVMELGVYDYDIKAKEGKRTLTRSVVSQSARPSTIAAAWPMNVKSTSSADDAVDSSGLPYIT